MNYKHIMISFLLILLTTQGAMAGIASRPFHSLGWSLSDLTLNPDKEAEANSANLAYASMAGKMNTAGIAEYDAEGSAMALAGNLSVENGLLSIGYTSSNAVADSNTLNSTYGYRMSETVDETNIGIGYLHATAESNIFLGIVNIKYSSELKETVKAPYFWGSTGSQTRSETATINTAKVMAGLVLHYSESVALGIIITPAYGGKETLDLSNTDVTYGHGDQVRFGVGYNTEKYSLGLDVHSEIQNKEYHARSSNGLSADSYYLVNEKTSFKALIEFESFDELKVDAYTLNAYTNRSLGFGFRFETNKKIFGIDFISSSSDYDAEDDTDVESTDTTVMQLGMTFSF